MKFTEILVLSGILLQPVLCKVGDYLASSFHSTTGCSKDSLTALAYVADSDQLKACPIAETCAAIHPGNNLALSISSYCTKESPEEDYKLEFHPSKPLIGSIMYDDPSCKSASMGVFLLADGSCLTIGEGSTQVTIGEDKVVTLKSFPYSLTCKGDYNTQLLDQKEYGRCMQVGDGAESMKIIVRSLSADSNLKPTPMPVGIIIGVAVCIGLIGLGAAYRQTVRQEMARITMQSATVSGAASNSSPVDDKQSLLR